MAIGNAALLDKLHHAVEDVFAIGVEAQDEAAHHLHPIALDGGHAVQQAAPRVLQLVGGDQPRLIRRLNAQKDRLEARILHQLHQLRIVGQVQRGLGQKVEADLVLARATRPAPRSNSLARALLPMKLSSTINTASRQPAARNWSSSASTCATALVRGRRP